MKNVSRREFLQLLSSVPGIYVASKLPIDKNRNAATPMFDDYSGIGSLFIQDSKAKTLHNPDEFGFYRGMEGTCEYPVYQCDYYGNITLSSSFNNILANHYKHSRPEDFFELEIVLLESSLSLLRVLFDNKSFVSLYFPKLSNDIGEYTIHLYNCSS